jgi:hypothetical protein
VPIREVIPVIAVRLCKIKVGFESVEKSWAFLGEGFLIFAQQFDEGYPVRLWQGASDCCNVAQEASMQAFHLDHEPEKFVVWPETGDWSLPMGWNPIDCRSKGVAPITLIIPLTAPQQSLVDTIKLLRTDVRVPVLPKSGALTAYILLITRDLCELNFP